MKTNSKLPYLFIAPAALLLFLFSYLPMPYSAYLSFQKIDIATGKYVFAGLENWSRILRDKNFWESCSNTFWFALLYTVIMLILAVIVALILNSKIKGASFYLTVMFIPWVISEVIVGYTWKWLLNPDYGVLNYLLGPFGIKASSLISDTTYALLGAVIVYVWRSLAYTTILVLAGLQAVPNDCLEAASIDGCNKWKTFTKVIFPILSPTILIVTLLNIINAISQSGIILVLTKGGPVRATETLALYLYKEAFINYQFSGAATMSIVLTVINLLIVAAYLYLNKRNREVIS